MGHNPNRRHNEQSPSPDD